MCEQDQEKGNAAKAQDTLAGVAGKRYVGYTDPYLRVHEVPAPSIEVLRKRQSESSEDLHRITRAINILERHPDFDDLIWLLRSGLV
jgi:hypothetical protein